MYTFKITHFAVNSCVQIRALNSGVSPETGSRLKFTVDPFTPRRRHSLMGRNFHRGLFLLYGGNELVRVVCDGVV